MRSPGTNNSELVQPDCSQKDQCERLSKENHYAENISIETFILSDRKVVEELGDRMGLLYTDAAHTVLCDLRRRRKSL